LAAVIGIVANLLVVSSYDCQSITCLYRCEIARTHTSRCVMHMVVVNLSCDRAFTACWSCRCFSETANR